VGALPAIATVVAAVIAVELAAFDDADFTELVDQAQQGAGRISGTVRQTGDLLAALVSVAASPAA
jgi:ATP-binding cassette, subfamily B, bacterial